MKGRRFQRNPRKHYDGIEAKLREVRQNGDSPNLHIDTKWVSCKGILGTGPSIQAASWNHQKYLALPCAPDLRATDKTL